HRNQEGLYASYSIKDDSKPFIQLEVEKIKETIDTSTFTSVLPDKIDERMRGVITDQFEGLPIGAFKLTTFIDGFTIGYYLNHAFFDQSSIFYFLKYLSHVYTFGKDHINLKKPSLVDTDYLSLSVNSPPVFKNLIDFREYDGAPMRYKYSSPKIVNII